MTGITSSIHISHDRSLSIIINVNPYHSLPTHDTHLYLLHCQWFQEMFAIFIQTEHTFYLFLEILEWMDCLWFQQMFAILNLAGSTTLFLSWKFGMDGLFVVATMVRHFESGRTQITLVRFFTTVRPCVLL
jgi:hypothetical protein